MQRKIKLINVQVKNIIDKANIDIQQIPGVLKYQKYYGNVVVYKEHKYDSIETRFRKNCFRLDNSIPKWSYPLIYDVALKESRKNVPYYAPECVIAITNAQKTVDELKHHVNNRQ
jgi:hypothetical protein